MQMTGFGYEFPCRVGLDGKVGIACSFSRYEGDKEVGVALTVCLDGNGRMVRPAVLGGDGNMVPMQLNGIGSFLRGNRMFFGRMGDFMVVAHGTAVFNKVDWSWEKRDRLCLYVPKRIDAARGVVICDSVGIGNGLNEFRVSAAVLSAYYSGLIGGLTRDMVSSKESFLRGLVDGVQQNQG